MKDDRSSESDESGISRRDFLTSVGAGTIGVAVAGTTAAAAPQAEKPRSDLVPLAVRVNARLHELGVEPRWTLLFVLRDKLGLTGTKPGCERGECGACTVLIDGIPRYACLTLALEVDGREVTTVEGLMDGEELGPVQRAFAEQDALQCGFCTPGQVMAAEGLLRQTPNPGIDEIRLGMSGNLCRCGAYDHITKAVRAAAASRK